ncbi:MAG: hypothetical protein KGM47_04615 [Acidobacteriota bacterium]|nr:hypothetical protein [Acidobacteriota bacterium]
MKILAFIIIAYTAVMLLIHVSTAKILEAWDESVGPAGSWIKRRFPPQRALRVEALYWVLTLVAWSFWRSLGWKVVVVVFAAIHLGIWAAGELHAIRLNSSDAVPANNHKAHRAIIAFDLIEAVMLVAIAWLSVLYLLRRG